MRIYSDASHSVWGAGLNPLPVSPASKKPCVNWKPWQTRRVTSGALRSFAEKHPDANIGTTTGGIVGLVVVDVDTLDQTVWQQCIDRWGDTPVKVRTASGKLHLWYTSPGGLGTYARVDGMPVDIRGDRGFIILPPSRRANGGEYEWLEGGLDDLRRVPRPKPGSMPERRATAGSRPFSASASPAPEEGRRNNELFRYLREIATRCENEAALFERAREWNERLSVPLGLAEVARTVRSVWGYVEKGTLMVPGRDPVVLLPVPIVDALAADEPDALALYALLRRHHAGVRQDFAVSARGFAAKLGWTRSRLRRARARLLEEGLIEQISEGGRRPGDPAVFRFTEGTSARGGGAMVA